jgi:ABC-type nitrate/sulfonate/bicarbonate transport system ATPase subunit
VTVTGEPRAVVGGYDHGVSTRAAAIEAQRISVSLSIAGEEFPVLSDVSLAAAPGDFASIIGPSGCGKSTLFNVLAGLMRPTSGAVLIDGVEVTGRIGLTGYMLQKDLLLPWRSVLDNTTLGLEMRGVPRRRARAQAREWVARFGLQGFEREYPAALSGGMRQRAALLRTFLAGQDILLLDEPFGALDALTRADMQRWLLDIWQELGKTILLVTHDVDEAIYLSDRVYVLSSRPGRVVEVIDVPLARPRDYQRTVTSPAFASIKRVLLSSLAHPVPGGGM